MVHLFCVTIGQERKLEAAFDSGKRIVHLLQASEDGELPEARMEEAKSLAKHKLESVGVDTAGGMRWIVYTASGEAKEYAAGTYGKLERDRPELYPPYVKKLALRIACRQLNP